jgi:predicted nucleic acid-binding Zn ribbon protein
MRTPRSSTNPAAVPLSEVLAELFARRGYARVQAGLALAQAWQKAAGNRLAAGTRPGRVRGGCLEVLVQHSALLQELAFEKQAILQRLAALLPAEGIRDLRWRVGDLQEG